MSSDGEAAVEHDPLEGLEARLHSHNRAFESLLALTPAREYYGSQIVDGRDPSEQWKRKKQTKEEKRAARKAKLDPANSKSALDVLREREREVVAKRKRDEGGEGEDDKDDDAEPQGKRRKSEDDADAAEAKKREKAEKRKEKRAKKKEKSEQKKAKAEAKKSRKQERDLADALAEKKQSRDDDQERDEDESDDEAEPFAHPTDIEEVDVSGLVNGDEEDAHPLDGNASAGSSAPTTPILNSPAFDLATNHSTASSSSSISPPSIHDQTPTQRRPELAPPALAVQPPATTPPPTQKSLPTTTTGTSSPKLTLPNINAEDLSARVRAKIDALRAARKADGPDGKPIKSRQELLDSRRKKQELRKANKKAARQKQKEEENRVREERLRGSGSPLSKVGDVFSPPPVAAPKYEFSRLAFEDGEAGDLEGGEGRKKKGPQDAKTAVLAAEKRDARFAGFRPEKQASVLQREMWRDASLRAQGGRGKEETSLLKKALKRKEKGKSKSEREWKEREDGVVKGKAAKQKKREANLAKRKEEKGAGGKGKGKAKKGGKKGGKKGRPGFEGRFKA